MPFKHKIDVARFVSLGDSITSGYTNGALYYEGQINCYPNLIARQINPLVEFKQPLLNKNSVGVGFFGNSRMVLKQLKDHSGKMEWCVAYQEKQGDLSVFANNCFASLGPFNNMSVPGSKAITTVVPGYGNPANGEGNYNPFFARMASDPSSASVLSDAVHMTPTFFTLFIGNNDILAYALSGGTTDAITPLEGPPGIGFAESLHSIVDTLTAQQAKGAIANIPEITSVPFFTTIPYNGLFLKKEHCDILNKKYHQQGIYFSEGENPFLIEASSPEEVRKIKKGEFILLDLLLDPDRYDYLKGIRPIPKKYILTLPEIAMIQKAVKEYNAVIKSIADSKSLAFVDTNAMLVSVKKDRVFNSSTLTLRYKRKGVFSLDGLHINDLGQTLLANEFIKAINNTYHCTVPKINFTEYRKLLSRTMTVENKR
ncbi:MAG: hypothetical protein HY062_03090 [Bacteroidetes bacterium]|nr:hypothetical protein [Bacteroidota bacterium]